MLEFHPLLPDDTAFLKYKTTPTSLFLPSNGIST